MADEMILDGKTYVSSKRASEMTKYTRDYIGQMCRSGIVDCQRVGSAWFIEQESLNEHASREGKWSKERIAEKKSKKEPAHTIRTGASVAQETVTVEGKEYISSKRASQITGYTQDYIGQLSRANKILSKSVGNRWYVLREDLEQHKQRADAQLASVQATSVGIVRNTTSIEPQSSEIEPKKPQEIRTHYNYSADERPLLPDLRKKEAAPESSVTISRIQEAAHKIEQRPMGWEKVSIHTPQPAPAPAPRTVRRDSSMNVEKHSYVGNPNTPERPERSSQSSSGARKTLLFGGLALVMLGVFAFVVFGLPGGGSDRPLVMQNNTPEVRNEATNPAWSAILNLLTATTEYRQP
jgi:hypothetical protein